ncbi:glycosyltransferase family 61 protein [Roseomonas frigidaquae]|uniref:Glycosyltransferase family 61 protein n=1 Tax=Falsiroseomonas frigidaquae TaxID=487318 RepID=A0ABX1F3S6_9PROT|nr:glycosyltransferase family 61 protein [Falsiroseomonas frigidaquae]
MPRIEVLDDALLIPASGRWQEPPLRPGAQGRTVYDGGVYAGSGEPLDLARHVGGNTANIPAAIAPSVQAEWLPGTWLFGGWLRRHFGHFVNESLGRLWAWPGLDEAPRGLIFLPFDWRLGANQPEVAHGPADAAWLPEILALLGIAPPPEIHVVTAPVRVARLVVPQQLSLLDTPGEPEAPRLHRRFLRGTAAPGVPTGRGYLSRSRLPSDLPSFILEGALDANFARAGYRVIHPEMLSIAQQVEAYRGLSTLVCAEGSAIHLAAIHLPDDVRLGMLWRLGVRHPPMFRQLRVAGLPPPAEFTRIAGVIASASPGQPSPEESLVGVNWRKARAVPDFALLGQDLAAAGFLDARHWQVPPAEEVAAAIAAHLAELRRLAPRQHHAWIPAARMPWRSARGDGAGAA